MDSEILLSSDEETEATPNGHPLEDKATVLKNLRSGFKYHKNGPAQMYDWTKEDISTMTEIIKESVDSIKKGRRKIRAVNYLGEEFPGGLLGWVNCVREGKYFADNPDISRGARFKSGEKTNFWLWNFVSETLLSEFRYWTKVHQKNSTVASSETKYPNIHQLVFRHTDDFVGGLWTDFSRHWQPFIDEMRYFNFAVLTFHV